MMKLRLLSAVSALAVALVLASPAISTVTSSAWIVTDNGNGSTTAFAYNFLIPYQSDAVTPAVTLTHIFADGTTAPITSNYTISGVGNTNGGSVTYPVSGSPLPSGESIIIQRSLAYTQPTAVSNTSFYPHTVEQMSDALELQIQQLQSGPNQRGTVTSISAGSGISTGAGAITSTGTVSLISPVAVALGGTGATSAASGFNNLSPITTTGDLIVGTGANTAGRLAAGTNGYVLTSGGPGVAPAWGAAGSAYNPAAVAITGGTINGTAVGSSVPSSGQFTTLNATQGTTPTFTFTNTLASPPNLTILGRIYFNSQLAHPIQAYIDGGMGGGNADRGGYLTFHTKADDGAGTDAEALVLTPGHQAYFPGGQYYFRFTTPGACTAGIQCTASVFTFPVPFQTTTGTPQQPNCPAAMIQDETAPSQMWVSTISAISSTSVTFSYAPMVNLPTAHTLDVYAICFSLSY